MDESILGFEALLSSARLSEKLAGRGFPLATQWVYVDEGNGWKVRRTRSLRSRTFSQGDRVVPAPTSQETAVLLREVVSWFEVSHISEKGGGFVEAQAFLREGTTSQVIAEGETEADAYAALWLALAEKNLLEGKAQAKEEPEAEPS